MAGWYSISCTPLTGPDPGTFPRVRQAATYSHSAVGLPHNLLMGTLTWYIYPVLLVFITCVETKASEDGKGCHEGRLEFRRSMINAVL